MEKSMEKSMFELPENKDTSAVIKVIGVGGGGGNAIEHMIAENVDGVEFICANTDLQALRSSRAKTLLQLGEELTKGLGAGSDPEIGRKAAEENREIIRDILSGADMIFLTAGFGGGTGTGAAPIIAEIAKEMGILTVAVVTKPFIFEGRKRMDIAHAGIEKLTEHVDSLITIPNNKLLPVLGKNISLLQAFRAANNVLSGAVQGIAELITKPGLINVDFADVRTVMSEMGMAMMGTADARGEERARTAAEAAISSPLLEDIDLTGAKGVLVNITASSEMSIGEFEEVGEVVKSFTSEDATVVVGTVIDHDMEDDLRVTVVVTGLGDKLGQMKRKSITSEPISTTNNVRSSISSAEPAKVDMMEAQKKVDIGVDYRKFEKPAILRNTGAVTIEEQDNMVSEDSVEYLDIPAFLRREDKK